MNASQPNGTKSTSGTFFYPLLVLSAVVSIGITAVAYVLLPPQRGITRLRIDYHREIKRVEKEYAPATARAVVELAQPYLTDTDHMHFSRRLDEATRTTPEEQTEKYSALILSVSQTIDAMIAKMSEDEEREFLRDIAHHSEIEFERWLLLDSLGDSFNALATWSRLIMEPIDKESTLSRYKGFQEDRKRLIETLERYKQLCEQPSR